MLILSILFSTQVLAQDKEMSAHNDFLLLTESDCGKSFLLSKKIEIHLSALTSAGYNWYLYDDHPEITISESSIKPTKLIGGPVTRTFTIEPKMIDNKDDINKKLNLIFVYKRHWEHETIKKCIFILKYRD